ncbi:MAG: transposase [Burkholderiales bacterium]
MPGHVWHITHRCHERAFFLKFARDRAIYLRWLFEARKRYGICVLNYAVTSNHVHLIVRDKGKGEIAQSMQSIAGRTAQQYNARKSRQGAFWQDRYHATAIETGEHLHRCLVYVDLNMVRAGAVSHPAEWEHGGYREIQSPRNRYRVIDLEELGTLCGFSELAAFQEEHRNWVDTALREGGGKQDETWTRPVAVGSEHYIAGVREGLGLRASHREMAESGEGHVLREPQPPYRLESVTGNASLRPDNTFPWDHLHESTTA